VQILRKYPSPPHGWSLEIPRGWGGCQKLKFLRESMKLNWNFLTGRWFKKTKQKTSMRGYERFL